MLKKEDIALIDESLFEIIRTDHISALLKSKTTGHIWRITVKEEPWHRFLVEHKRHNCDPFHGHGSGKTMRSALKKIERHDADFLEEVKQGKRSRGQLGPGCSFFK